MPTLPETFQEIKEKIDIVELIGEYVELKRSGKSYRGLCPFHNEKGASFFVRPETRSYKCFGCSAGGDAIDFVSLMDRVNKIDAAKKLGGRVGVKLPEPERKQSSETEGRWLNFPDGTERRFFSGWGEFVKEYVYEFANGEHRFSSVRFNPKDFRQGRYTDQGWKWNVPETILVPYRLPQITAAIAAKKVIYICEGEKDAENVAALGLAGTTLPRGADKPWQKGYDVLAKADRVVILADNDSIKDPTKQIGLTHARKTAANLWNLGAKQIKIVIFPKHKDVSDWLAAGGTAKQLVEIVKATPNFVPDWQLSDPEPAEDNKPVETVPAGLPLFQSKPSREELRFLNRPGGYIPDTDSANGARFSFYFGKDWKHAHERGWMHFDGKRWHYDATNERYEYAKQIGIQILNNLGYIEDFKARADLEKFAKKCFNRSQLDNLLALAKSEDEIRSTLAKFDSEDTDLLLNFGNGTVDLTTGELREHRREDLITRVIPVEYNGAAECPLWFTHLNKVFSGNEDVIDWFWRLAGYCATGLTRDHVLPFFEGGGANGKSITVNVLSKILGEYAGTLPTTTLMLKQNENNLGNDIAAALPKRFVVVSEAAEGMRINESLLKQLTGGDEISVRFLHKEFFDARPKFKLVMTGNSRPRVTGNDHGLWRRIKLVRFEQRFAGPERIPDFHKILIAREAQGIAAWLVRGAQEYLKRGLEEPECIQHWTEEYKQASDPTGSFLAERCVLKIGKPDYCEKAQALYDAMKSYCDDNGFHCPSINTFSERLKAHGLERVRKIDANYYVYVNLKEEYRK